MKLPNKERIKKVLEIRRSNAAQPIPSKKVYSRKRKHKKTAVGKKTNWDQIRAPAKTVGAKSSLRQVINMLEICEILHKNNFRHADAQMVNVSNLMYNS